jgi:hypothetical protein
MCYFFGQQIINFGVSYIGFFGLDNKGQSVGALMMFAILFTIECRLQNSKEK